MHHLYILCDALKIMKRSRIQESQIYVIYFIYTLQTVYLFLKNKTIYCDLCDFSVLESMLSNSSTLQGYQTDAYTASALDRFTQRPTKDVACITENNVAVVSSIGMLIMDTVKGLRLDVYVV